MSSRAHLGLRLAALAVLVALTAWPRDRAVMGAAGPAHVAVTAAARLRIDEAPRGRIASAPTDEPTRDGLVNAPPDTSATN